MELIDAEWIGGFAVLYCGFRIFWHFHQNGNGRGALRKAARLGDYDSAQSLLNQGVNPDCDNLGEPPLYVASKFGNLDIAGLLLEKGASVNGRRTSRNTPLNPLYIAVNNNKIELVRLLLENGCDVNFQGGDISCPFAIDLACYKNYFEIVELLMSKTPARMCNDTRQRIYEYYQSKEPKS